MYGIFTCICSIFTVNLGKYTILAIPFEPGIQILSKPSADNQSRVMERHQLLQASLNEVKMCLPAVDNVVSCE